ncbi:MAG: hypothetical protein HY200_02410 [Nitrospirae bacterium]|nr:hypothetical protein [Nitrospirota bacterium]MBI3593788.1 hypothetical protein [Nitrospirota bacterium]
MFTMNYSEKQIKEIFKILNTLKDNLQDSLDYAFENIEMIQMDSYFTAEDKFERIVTGVQRLEEELREGMSREKLKQFETRLLFLEERFEEIDAELRQRPVRRRRPKISLIDFFRMSQEEAQSPSYLGEFSSQHEAFAAFNLDPGTPLKTVTATFRKMAKELHPDSRGGDRSEEPKLRRLIAAYQYIKEFYTTQ